MTGVTLKGCLTAPLLFCSMVTPTTERFQSNKMSNLINLQTRLAQKSRELVAARNDGDEELVERLEDEIFDLEDEIEELQNEEYGDGSEKDW